MPDNGINLKKPLLFLAVLFVVLYHCKFKIRHRPGQTLRLGIGIHSGPCAAGIVGLKMPRYCLFGEVVHFASVMESSGEAFKIHCSRACKDVLERIGGFDILERGYTELKEGHEELTFWILGEDLGYREKRKNA